MAIFPRQVVVIVSLKANLISIVIVLRMLIRKLSSLLGATSQRIVFKSGWISRRTEEVSLPTIEEINLEQKILGERS